MIPGESPLYLGLYVDNFPHFSTSTAAKQKFKSLMAFTLDVVDCYNLMTCNKSPRATPFMSGFPVDNIDPSSLSPPDQAKLLKKYQLIIGDLNWLSISTHPDITTIVSSLLAARTQSPDPAHFESTLHVLRYVASTPSHGLYYMPDNTEPFHAFIHFPKQDSQLQAYWDAKWDSLYA